MDRRASSFSARRVSELLSRVEQIEQQSREQADFLQIQFKRIAQMQAELDRLRAESVKGRRQRESFEDQTIAESNWQPLARGEDRDSPPSRLP